MSNPCKGINSMQFDYAQFFAFISTNEDPTSCKVCSLKPRLPEEATVTEESLSLQTTATFQCGTPCNILSFATQVA